MQELSPKLFLARAPSADASSPFTFLAVRRAGNLLFATKADISPFYDKITKQGGASVMLLGDRHHAGPHTVKQARYFKLPLTCSAVEATALRRTGIEVDNALPFMRQQLDEDLEILPTPGHTPGAFSYLWRSGSRRYLFLGDTLVPVEGKWRYWVNKPGRTKMIESMRLLDDVEFDTIVVNSFACTTTPCIRVTPKQKSEILRTVIKELSAL